MKHLILLFGTVLILGGSGFAQETEYVPTEEAVNQLADKIAKRMCNCYDNHIKAMLSNVSISAVDKMVEYGMESFSIEVMQEILTEEELMVLAEEFPVAAANEGFGLCLDNYLVDLTEEEQILLETTSETEDEQSPADLFEVRLVEILRSAEGCRVVYFFFQIGAANNTGE